MNLANNRSAEKNGKKRENARVGTAQREKEERKQDYIRALNEWK